MWDKFDDAIRAKGLLKGDLAERLGVAPSRLSKWRAKPENLSVVDAARIARQVGISLDYWLNDDAEAPAGEPVTRLTADEAVLVDTFRASGLSRLEAMRRLIQDGHAARATTPDQGRRRATRVRQKATPAAKRKTS